MKTLARSACVAVLMLLLAATASPAAAKGPTSVDVEGPGIDRTLDYFTKSGVDVDLGSLSEAARIFDIYGTNRPGPPPEIAGEALGARFVLTWDLGEGDIVQHAYPFAEGGAWVHFLPGQDMFGRPVTDGWSPTPALTEQLVELGAVATAESTTSSNPPEQSEQSEQSGDSGQQPALAPAEAGAAPVVTDDESGGGTSYDVGVPAGLLLAGVLAVGGVVVWRRRRVSP